MITIYQTNKLDSYYFSDEDHSIFPNDFSKVADIDTDDLDEAYSLSQNVTASWACNNEVKSDLKQCRSTSMGDILEKAGEYFIVDMFGFKKIELKAEL